MTQFNKMNDTSLYVLRELTNLKLSSIQTLNLTQQIEFDFSLN